MDKEVQASVDLYEFADWFQANRKQVISITVGVLAVAAIIGIYFWRKNYMETAAEGAISEIQAPGNLSETANPPTQPYLKIADDYPGTKAAARALLMAGGNLFDEGKFDQAKSVFDRFMREYSDSPLANEALLGVAASLEAQGKTADAATHYEDLVRHHAGDSTTTQAKSALARCYMALNKPEQAYHLYDELTHGNNNDTWTAEARFQMQEVLAKNPGLLKAAAPAELAPTAAAPLAVPAMK